MTQCKFIFLSLSWFATSFPQSQSGLRGETIPEYSSFEFQFKNSLDRIVPADLDGDGRKDLLFATKSKLRMFFQRSTGGFEFKKPDLILELPGRAVGWDLDHDTLPQERVANAALRILALVEGKRVVAWSLKGRRLSEEKAIKSNLRGFLPEGAYPLHFVRDVNGDDRNDLVIPGAGLFFISFCQDDGSYQGNLQVRSEVNLRASLSTTNELAGQLGQAIKIPLMKLRDVNGDGLKDLVARTDDRLEVFLAAADGAFPPKPNTMFDIAAVRARLGSFDPDKLDFSNLSSLVSLTYETKLVDVDGDGIEDLLVREGGKVLLFGGEKDRINLKRPRQILKSAGNVLTAILFDEDEDGRDDLWLVRIEAVSIGDIFLWLVVSGSLDIEAFVYKNNGRRFDRRPSRKLTVTIKFPSILSLIELGEEIEEKVGKKKYIPQARARISSRAGVQDLLLLEGGSLKVYLKSVAAEKERNPAREFLDYSRTKDHYVLDIRDVIDKLFLGEDDNLKALKDRQADFELPIGTIRAAGKDGDQSGIVVLELNGDAFDDMLVIANDEEKGFVGTVLLSTMKER